MVTYAGLEQIIQKVRETKGEFADFPHFSPEVDEMLKTYSLILQLYNNGSKMRIREETGIKDYGKWASGQQNPLVFRDYLKRVPINFSEGLALAYVLGAFYGMGTYMGEPRHWSFSTNDKDEAVGRKLLESVVRIRGTEHIHIRSSWNKKSKKTLDYIAIQDKSFRRDIDEILHNHLIGYVSTREEIDQFVAGMVDLAQGGTKFGNPTFFVRRKTDAVGEMVKSLLYLGGYTAAVGEEWIDIIFKYSSDLKRIAELTSSAEKRRQWLEIAEKKADEDINLEIYEYILSQKGKKFIPELAKETGINRWTIRNWFHYGIAPAKAGDLTALRRHYRNSGLGAANIEKLRICIRVLRMDFEGALRYSGEKSLTELKQEAASINWDVHQNGVDHFATESWKLIASELDACYERQSKETGKRRRTYNPVVVSPVSNPLDGVYEALEQCFSYFRRNKVIAHHGRNLFTEAQQKMLEQGTSPEQINAVILQLQNEYPKEYDKYCVEEVQKEDPVENIVFSELEKLVKYLDTHTLTEKVTRWRVNLLKSRLMHQKGISSATIESELKKVRKKYPRDYLKKMRIKHEAVEYKGPAEDENTEFFDSGE